MNFLKNMPFYRSIRLMQWYNIQPGSNGDVVMNIEWIKMRGEKNRDGGKDEVEENKVRLREIEKETQTKEVRV